MCVITVHHILLHYIWSAVLAKQVLFYWRLSVCVCLCPRKTRNY